VVKQSEYILVFFDSGLERVPVNTPRQVREARQIMWIDCIDQTTVYRNGQPIGTLYCSQDYEG
jgi:hypothetical protein